MSAAIHLASAGRRVLVLEQNARVGGKMGEMRQDGFRWDTGPSVITMRHVFEALFSTAGRRLEDYIQLKPIEPLTRYFFADGTRIDAYLDPVKMLAEVERIAPHDVLGFQNFLKYAANLYRITGPVFIYEKPPTWSSFLKVAPWDVLQVDGLRSMGQAIDSYVRSPHLRQLLRRFATYVGANPYLAPATLNVISHVELSQGVWVPRGGVYALAQAYRRLADELGVELRCQARVVAIEVQDGRAVGVSLENGERLPGAAVIANLDVATTYQQLLPTTPAVKARLTRLAQVEPSSSGFILLLGIQGQSAELAHHNIFFSRDYIGEFHQIFDLGVPPEEPTVYLSVTSKNFHDDAPAGCENWFILVNAPAIGPAWDWLEQAEPYADLVLERLASFGFDVRSRILCRHIFTPVDIERLTGARRGALYGASSNNRWAAFRRSHNRCPDVAGLYFAGGTVHPGGGVPMVTLSGKVAAGLVLADDGKG